MRPIALFHLVGGLLAFSLHAAPMPAIIKSADVAAAASKFSAKNPLDSTGLAFFHDRLFVGCNLGLLEFSHGALTCMYEWTKRDDVTEGVWRDDVHGLLWTWLPGGGLLAYYNGTTWQKVAVPEPKQGYTSRGDVLEGYRAAGNETDFWLEGAGHAWTWQSPKNQWQEKEGPPPGDANTNPLQRVVRVIPTANRIYFVIRSEPGWKLVGPRNTAPGRTLRSDIVCFKQEDGSWQTVENQTGDNFFAEQTLALKTRAYLRTNHGALLEITAGQIKKVETPGVCEALAKTSRGTLLAAFQSGAICERTEQWEEICRIPAIPAGNRWVHLAESDHAIAYSSTPQPRLVPKGGINYDTVYDSSPSLWLFETGKLRQLSWPPVAAKP